MGNTEEAGRRIAVSNLQPAQPLLDDRLLKDDKVAEARSLGQPAPVHLFVADTAISEADIAREMQYHPAGMPEQSRADAARALVVRELLRRECDRLGLLAASPGADRESAEEAAIACLLEREIERKTPDEAICRHYYEQNQVRFHTPARVRARHILLAAAPNDSRARTAARDRGQALVAQLAEQPHLFADLALRFSDCPSRDKGGDLGWLTPGQTTSEFDRQIFRLPQGLADFAVESRWGYHVVMIDERVDGRPQDFAEVKEWIARYLELQTHQQELQVYLQKLQFEYGVRGLEEIEAAVPS